MATFHFEEKELGQKLSDAELDELKRNRYGDVRGRQANLAETPAQLLLEAASAKQATGKKTIPDVSQNPTPIKPCNHLEVSTKAPESQVDDGKKGGDGLNKVATTVRKASPVKQREYRRPDGRKRIIPEAVGVSVESQALDFPTKGVNNRKDDNGVVLSNTGVREGSMRRTICGNSDVKERSGVTARATVSESLVIEKVPASEGRDGSVCVEPKGIVEASTSGMLLIRVFDKKEGNDAVPVCLEARPRERAVNDIVGVGNTFTMRETEIACTKGADTLWSDRVSGKVTVLAGNANFWAVGCEDGCLQVSMDFLDLNVLV